MPPNEADSKPSKTTIVVMAVACLVGTAWLQDRQPDPAASREWLGDLRGAGLGYVRRVRAACESLKRGERRRLVIPPDWTEATPAGATESNIELRGRELETRADLELAATAYQWSCEDGAPDEAALESSLRRWTHALRLLEPD